MTRAYLLDTNHLGEAVRRASRVRDRIQQLHQTGVRSGTCVAVLCELEVGFQHASNPDDFRRRLDVVLRRVRLWPLEKDVAQVYGSLAVKLKKMGQALSAVDLQLAALAKLKGLTLLTSDRDFEALPEIRTENWLS